MDDHDGREKFLFLSLLSLYPFCKTDIRVLFCIQIKTGITGVQEIHSFNENEVLLLSEAGKILLKGEQLHVRNLNLEKGDAEVEGRVDSLSYLTRNAHKKDESILKRMFR